MFTVFISLHCICSRWVSRLNLDDYSKEKLWQLLVDAVHGSVMYPSHKAYVRDAILPAQPDVSPLELSERLNMPLAEAMVILEELAEAKKSPSNSAKIAHATCRKRPNQRGTHFKLRLQNRGCS